MNIATFGKFFLIVALFVSSFPAPAFSAPVTKAAAHPMVGTWQAEVNEFGQRFRIVWRINADGTSAYRFIYRDGFISDYGVWGYENGVVYEEWPSGLVGAGAVRWVNNNYFVLTILENGNPLYRGLQRHYTRIAY